VKAQKQVYTTRCADNWDWEAEPASCGSDLPNFVPFDARVDSEQDQNLLLLVSYDDDVPVPQLNAEEMEDMLQLTPIRPTVSKCKEFIYFFSMAIGRRRRRIS
jgi:hypothetical protein